MLDVFGFMTHVSNRSGGGGGWTRINEMIAPKGWIRQCIRVHYVCTETNVTGCGQVAMRVCFCQLDGKVLKSSLRHSVSRPFRHAIHVVASHRSDYPLSASGIQITASFGEGRGGYR